MARVVSVFLPTWPTDRLRRAAGDAAPSAETPVVVAGRDGNRRVLTAVDAAARAAGLVADMPLAKAQVLLPGLVVAEADTRADAESLERLALWLLQRVSPIVAVDPPNGIVIDSTGADHLHGGEAAVLDLLMGRLTMSGVAARAAIADTWGAAHALARFTARPTVIAPMGHGGSVVLPLPLEALRLPASLTAGLRTLGFVTVGDVLAQPRAPLILRFGPQLGRRIGQALGEVAEPIEPLRPADLVEVRRPFAEPIGAAETIARTICDLVPRLCAELERRDLGARRVDLLCYRVDDRIETVRVGLATPVRDPKRLTRLLRDRIETIAPGFGIELMSLTATLAEPLAERQALNGLVEEGPPDLSDLIDVLANRVGSQAIYRFAPVASDVPERSVRRIAALEPETGAGWPDHWPWPSRLLARPEAIETMALLPDHPPVWIAWRRVRRRVRSADGPERVFGEWWRADAELVAVRDYFRVEDEAGERFWIYRAGDGEHPETGSQRWFLHGIFG